MGPVISKLTNLIGEEYAMLKGVRKKLKSLTKELIAIHAFLEKYSGIEGPDVQAKVWMNEVRELAYDIEDSIDLFTYHVDREPADNNTGIKRFLRKALRKVKKLEHRHKFAKQIQELQTQVNEVYKRRVRYNLDEGPSSNMHTETDPRLKELYVQVEKLVGVEGPSEEIISRFIGEEPTKQLKVISLVGPGGSGKTTLAKQVFEKIKSQFFYTAFVSVSQKPNINNLMRFLLSEIGSSSGSSEPMGSYSDQHLINKLRAYLEKERWIAEGFITAKQGYTLEEIGESHFNELINRSMIQPIDMTYDGKASVCRVHDIVLNFIISRSTEENFVTVLDDQDLSSSHKRIRRLSIWHNNEHAEAISQGTMDLSHLRSLNICRVVGWTMPPVLDLPVLQTLDLEGYYDLTDVPLDGIEKLPVQIGKLEYLQTLDLRSTSIRDLPGSIVQLILPDGFGSMAALQELGRLDGCRSSVKDLQFLSKLRVLRVTSLCKLGASNLRSLYINDRLGGADSFTDSWYPPLFQKLTSLEEVTFPETKNRFNMKNLYGKKSWTYN